MKRPALKQAALMYILAHKITGGYVVTFEYNIIGWIQTLDTSRVIFAPGLIAVQVEDMGPGALFISAGGNEVEGPGRWDHLPE